MHLVIASILLALMFIPVIGFLSTRLFEMTPRGFITLGIIGAILVYSVIAYRSGTFDSFLWDISMPNLPADEQKYIQKIRPLVGKADNPSSSCEVVSVDNWIGKVEYSLFFGMRPAVAVRIDSHIVLHSPYLPQDDSVPAASDQFGDLATGQMVHVSGAFPVSQGCPSGKGQWRMNDNSDLEATFEFSSIKPF